MAERRPSYEGVHPTQRQRSPTREYPSYQFESLNAAVHDQAPQKVRTRRRSSRSGSGSQVSSQSASSSQIDGDVRSGKRSKSGRNTLKKTHRRDSAHSEVSTKPYEAYNDIDHGPAVFVPRLGQIREDKVSKPTYSRNNSTVSSGSNSPTHRRQQIQDQAVDRSRVRRRHESSSRKHRGHTGWQSNLSAPSVLSATSTRSSNSLDSRTTITQALYGAESVIDGPVTRSSQQRAAPITMEPTETDVFRYMSEDPSNEGFTIEEVHDTPPSTIAPSSSASNGDSDSGEEEYSSDEEVDETPTASPASVRDLRPPMVSHHSGSHRDPLKPLYASSFVHGHGEGENDDNDDDGVDDDDESEEGESAEHSEDEEEEIDAEEGEHSDIVHNNHDSGHQALARTAPPSVPSTAAPSNDMRSRRLRQQEQELANHILKSPQPHKEFQFSGAPSPQPIPTRPLYSPRAYSNTTPAQYGNLTGYQPEWPQYPPPLPISYPNQPSIESPTSGHALPLTVQPPPGIPIAVGHQAVQPAHPYSGVPPPHYQAHVPVTDMTRTTVAGYELLANKLSEPCRGNKASRKGGIIVPMYRKFENLNHRVLLHLQDEICEMEEELRDLDEEIIQTSPKDESGRAYPASRRGDTEYGNELHYKRTELLGRVFQKLGQYNQALTSFNNLVRENEPASLADIQAYRAWLDKREPIDEEERRFLDRKHDLLAVSRRPSVSTTRGGQSMSATAYLPLALVLPLLTFVIVPSMLGRLAVVAVVGGAGLRLATTTPEVQRLLGMQEWMFAGASYFGFMALLAGVVR